MLLEFQLVIYTSKLNCKLMWWKAKSMLEMDLRWIRNNMVCLDGGWLLMEGKYQLYNVVGYWKWL